MEARGAALRQYLAHTIAPAARKVKEVHNKYDESVDIAYGCVNRIVATHIVSKFTSLPGFRYFHLMMRVNVLIKWS